MPKKYYPQIFSLIKQSLELIVHLYVRGYTAPVEDETEFIKWIHHFPLLPHSNLSVLTFVHRLDFK